MILQHPNFQKGLITTVWDTSSTFLYTWDRFCTWDAFVFKSKHEVPHLGHP